MTAALAPSRIQGVGIGPTWQRGEDGKFIKPKHTLGWQILGWTKEYLNLPDGPNAGEPWVFTDEQARFVLWWYAVNEQGGFIYRRGMLRRLKGWGKDPVGAVLCAVEFVGPCRLRGWKGGEPVAMEHPAPWVQTAAVAKDQTRNTMTLFPGLFSQRAIEEFKIDLGKEIIYAHRGKARIEAVTSSPRALEGGRSTFTLKNEALALDTPLPTPDGWTTVGEIEPGQLIYGSQGPVKVLKATPIAEDRPCYRVHFEDGTSLVTDEGHLWYAKRTSSAAKPRIWRTSEMATDAHGRQDGFMVPLPVPLESPSMPLPIDPYLLGLWLGDGESDAAGIAVGKEDAQEVLAATRLSGSPAAVLTRTQTGKALRISLRGNEVGRLHSKDGSSFRGRLRQLEVWGQKRIPVRYLRGSREQRLSLLQGLMDSDGSITESQSQAIFVNQNEALARGVVELARSLGYRVGITSRVDDRWRKPLRCWRVTFRADSSANPFRLKRKASKVSGHRNPWKSIKSIEKVESVPVRCIEVESDDHLFVAGVGWTLTHNTHWWLTGNEGHEMAAVIARNAAKSRDGSSRVLAISNAHNPGEDSDAEHDYETWLKIEAGQTRATGFLYDSLEAPADVELSDRDSLYEGILAARGDSIWLDPDRLIEEIYDPGTPPSTSRRFYLNQIIAAEDAWLAPHEWDTCKAESVIVGKGEQITLGFDGSKSGDHSVLVGCRVDDSHLFPLGAWDPAKTEDGLVPTAEVDAAVQRAFQTYDVVGFYADVNEWESYTDKWEQEHGDRLCARSNERHPVKWDMRRGKETTLASESYLSGIIERDLSHANDPLLNQYHYNARRRPNIYGVTFSKESPFSARKVDGVAAAMLARKARQDYMALPDNKKRRPSGPPRYSVLTW